MQRSPANDLQTPTLRTRATRRGELLASALFAGGALAAFLILLACVLAATFLYYRWH